MNDHDKHCPRCGAWLDAEVSLVHDGYRGSSSAHAGAGSTGMARHHFYWRCPCGWSERPDLARQGRRAGRRTSRLVLPEGVALADCVELPCPSRQTRAHELAQQLAEQRGLLGGITRHYAGSSCRYALLPRAILEEAEAVVRAQRSARSRPCAPPADVI